MILHFQSSLAPHIVVEYLSDPERFVRIHPIIYRMEPLSGNTFKVYEKVKFGFIPYSFTYTAEIEQNIAERTVHVKAVIKRMTHISMLFKVNSSATGSVIEESIEIKSPLPIKAYLLRLLAKQHQVMFANMEKMETSALIAQG